jgi:purine nucleoside phosphorylase
MSPGTLVIPSQLIDYTWGREQTYFDNDFLIENHSDFTNPYNAQQRQDLLNSAVICNHHVVDGGVMGVTQGPRLETAAEIVRMKKDGCDIVGMTGMPEAGLARELGVPYVCLAIVVNWAAGIAAEEISISGIERVLKNAGGKINEILAAYA